MRILLHMCCAPCSTHVIKELSKENEAVLFFYNPNIYPEEEYKKRLENAEKAAAELGAELEVGEYNHEKWLESVKGLEKEKEGGKRCEKCFEIRLRESAEKAKELGCDAFTTTLTVSPYKNMAAVNKSGKQIGEEKRIKFLERDFKKKEGYLKSIQMSKELGLYRQHYCGCEFSLNKSIASPKEKNL